jgi:8-oxo-dGTP diphosphatase
MPGSEDRKLPSVTVDVVVVARLEGRHKVLLVKRKNPPYQGRWAIPGGFVEPDEPLESAARRELREETGAEPVHLEQLRTFGDPGRDPRGWTISVTYLARLSDTEACTLAPEAGSDAGAVHWFVLHDPPSLAFDHAEILAYAAHYLAETDST